MTVKQSFLKALYHLFLLINKFLPNNTSVSLINDKHLKPLSTIYDIQICNNKGESIYLSDYKGKKILLVNTASNCGFTAQYEELQTLYKKYDGKLVIIGFPSNDFRHQEPNGDSEIEKFCKINFGVSFPIMKKSGVVKGEKQNEMYKWLSDSSKNGWCNQQPTWNFCKYLVDENGILTHFFKQTISPLDKKVIEAIVE